MFGCRGSVTGPARNGDADAVSMSFSGNRGDIHCLAEELSREPAPSLPGGVILGEHLYFTAGGSRAIYRTDDPISAQWEKVADIDTFWDLFKT